MDIPVLKDIQDAASRIKPYIHHTPVLTNSAINKICGGEIYFNNENTNFQMN